MGSHLIRSTSLSPGSGFCFARKRVFDAASMHIGLVLSFHDHPVSHNLLNIKGRDLQCDDIMLAFFSLTLNPIHQTFHKR